jgi:hypothetical protein
MSKERVNGKRMWGWEGGIPSDTRWIGKIHKKKGLDWELRSGRGDRLEKRRKMERGCKDFQDEMYIY